MRRHSVRSAVVPLITLVLALSGAAATASGDHEGGHGHEDGHGHDEAGTHAHGHADFEFGTAAPAAEADRTVEIVAQDSMRFEPDRVTVEPGETVRFAVRNAGQLQHSFTLGSPSYQRRHDKEMADMPMDEMAHHMDDSPNGIVVQPGQTASLTWRFERGGPIEFACHIPGHYGAGMKGRVHVSE